MKDAIVFGDRMMPITLPDDVRLALPGLSTTLPAAENIEEAIRSALLEPLGRPPLQALVKSDYRVTIAFDDPSVPCFAPTACTANLPVASRPKFLGKTSSMNSDTA
jgi:Lactate racemase N-terminal domain